MRLSAVWHSPCHYQQHDICYEHLCAPARTLLFRRPPGKKLLQNGRTIEKSEWVNLYEQLYYL